MYIIYTIIKFVKFLWSFLSIYITSKNYPYSIDSFSAFTATDGMDDGHAATARVVDKGTVVNGRDHVFVTVLSSENVD